jgi:hypothetical protein
MDGQGLEMVHIFRILSIVWYWHPIHEESVNYSEDILIGNLFWLPMYILIHVIYVPFEVQKLQILYIVAVRFKWKTHCNM